MARVGARREGEALTGKATHVKNSALIITTTPEIQDRKVLEYLGIVAGEAVIGTNIFGGILRNARAEALREMANEARTLGADAVAAVNLDYAVLDFDNSMLMVSASGTAVKLA